MNKSKLIIIFIHAYSKYNLKSKQLDHYQNNMDSNPDVEPNDAESTQEVYHNA